MSIDRRVPRRFGRHSGGRLDNDNECRVLVSIPATTRAATPGAFAAPSVTTTATSRFIQVVRGHSQRSSIGERLIVRDAGGVEIRIEQPRDAAAIRSVHAAAFAGDTPEGHVPDEVGLVDALRGTDAWVPALSLVAVDDGEIVGHCLTTRAHIGSAQVLGLGPIGVLPTHQGRGIGSTLMVETIDAAEEHGELLIGLVGDPRFYSRFGFVPSTEVDITPPDASWGRYFQIRTLAAYRHDVVGEFRYAPPFDDL